jgi:PadR family transcriptional regulator PadR
MTRSTEKAVVPQGTLDLLILKTLSLEPMHGLGISKRLEQITRGTFQVNPGSFFPALHLMEQEGWIRGQWGRSENNRRAKYYHLTKAGRNRLQQQERHWRRTVSAITRVLEAT